MKPIRIQRKRTKGWRMPKNTVYVGRPTRWGNPFLVGVAHYEKGEWVARSQKQAVESFEEWLSNRRVLDPLGVADIRYNLKGKNLCCWCPIGMPCHADVLLYIANL